MRAHRRSKAASFIRCNGLTRSVLLWAHCERARFFRKLPGDTPRRVAQAGSTLVFIVAEMTTESRASPRGLSLTSLRRGINVNGESSRSLVAGDQRIRCLSNKTHNHRINSDVRQTNTRSWRRVASSMPVDAPVTTARCSGNNGATRILIHYGVHSL